MRKPLTLIIATATILAALAAGALASSNYVRLSGYAEKPVTGAAAMTYVLRSSYIAPGSWKAAKAKPRAIVHRFGPVGSCRIKITISARAIADVNEAAPDRVTRLLPATRRYVEDSGTRGTAAWRVIRTTGSKTVVGMLVRPATTVRTQLPSGRVWLELRAIGKVDPTVECHAGGPRSVAAAFGDLLAAGSLGGFEPR